MELWFNINCPKCSTRNWVYNGQAGDMTFFEDDACACWSCKHSFWLSEDIEDLGYNKDDPPSEYATEGRRNPSRAVEDLLNHYYSNLAKYDCEFPHGMRCLVFERDNVDVEDMCLHCLIERIT